MAWSLSLELQVLGRRTQRQTTPFRATRSKGFEFVYKSLYDCRGPASFGEGSAKKEVLSFFIIRSWPRAYPSGLAPFWPTQMLGYACLAGRDHRIQHAPNKIFVCSQAGESSITVSQLAVPEPPKSRLQRSPQAAQAEDPACCGSRPPPATHQYHPASQPHLGSSKSSQ